MLRRPRISLAALALAAVPALTVLTPAARADATTPPLPIGAFGTSDSGYVAGGGSSTVAIQAIATWVQPAGNCTATTTGASFSAGVGNPFGGPVTPYSGPLEQTGTDTDCSGGSPVYSAWYSTAPYSRVTWGGAVHAGDTMTASVNCSPSTLACNLRLGDRTAGWSANTTQTVSSLPGSAEINISRVYSNLSLQPLTNFGTVTFNNASFAGWRTPTQRIIANGWGTPLDSISALVTDSTPNTYFSGTWLAAS